MPSVIKSPYARVVAPVKPVIKGEISEPENHEVNEIKETVAPSEEELRRAYDELIMAAQEEVALIFEDARKNVEEMKAGAQEEIEEQRAEIYENAYSEAYEKGYAEGIDAANEKMAAVLKKAEEDADALLKKAYAERDKLLDESENRILELVVKIAEKILKMELERTDQAYISMVTNALGKIKSENHVTLRVNPGDYVKHFQSHETVLNTVNGNVTAEVVNDSTIPYGGCLIETEGGAVDAGVDAQIERTAQALGLME